MTDLDTKWYLLRNGQGRIESSTHPDTRQRVFHCHGCGVRGDGEGRDHFEQGCITTVFGSLPNDHFQ